MQKAFTTLVLLAVMAITATAQAPSGTATKDASIGPVVLKPESYAELDKIQEQLTEAKEDEAAALSNYEAKAARRVAMELALQVAALRALMAVGVTDPTRQIAEPPKPAPEAAAPKAP